MPAPLAIDGGTPVRQTKLLFGAPALGEEEAAEVLDTLRGGWIGTGPKTARFEAAFAQHVGVPHAVAVSSCTAALHLSLAVSGVGAGDEVITSPLTFAATANVVVHQNATPVFADIDPHRLTLDPAAVRRAITPRTKAILPVHFGGLPAPLDELDALAREHGLTLIEDAAHAVHARYRGRMIGSHGHLTCFSFYANKNLTTGEGGMVTTADAAAAAQLSTYRLHGLSADAWRRLESGRLVLSEAVVPGFKYNLTDMQASLGLHQLRKQEAFLAARERLAARFDAAFADLTGVRRQQRSPEPGTRHALHLYVLILDPAQFRVDRNAVVNALLAENIGAAIHYRALHTHAWYRDRFGFAPEAFPVAAAVGDRIFSLPLHPGMTDRDADDVIDAVHKVLGAYRR